MIPLFPIPLLGAGTAAVESFPSYLHRCAVDHGVFVGEFLRHLNRHGRVEPVDSEKESWPELPRYTRVPELVRPSRTTNMLVDFMERGTGQALRQSTFWFMDQVLGRSSNEVCKTFRWCPECIREMVLTGQPTYFKLIWHLNEIRECPLHGTPFLTHCPYCGSEQDSYVKTGPLHHCVYCGNNIGIRRTPLRREQIVDSWHRQGNDLTLLMEDLAKMEELSFPFDGVRESLTMVFDHYWREDREEELYQILPRDPLVALLDTDRPISLKIARRFAYRLGISLFDLMNGNAHQTFAVLNSNWLCQLPPAFMERQHKVRRDHQAVMRKIRTIMRESRVPLPLCKVAQQAGVSVGYLEYRYPAMVRKIVDDYQRHIDEQRKGTIRQAQSAAMGFFFDEHYSSEPKSRKAAYRVLRKETGLPKFVLKQAIKEAYSVMNG